MGTLLLFIVIILIVYYVYKTFYFIKVDNTLMFTGAPGTGKTNEMVRMALKLLKAVRRRTKRNNWKILLINMWHKGQKGWLPLQCDEMPKLYSNIPIKISRKEWSTKLKLEHLTLQESQTPRAITVITEIGKIVSRYDHQNPNISDNIDEYVSLYRQFTLGGYFLCDDQSSDNAEVDIRRRLGTIINMLHFTRFWIFYFVKMRNITISEDIKTIEKDSVEDNYKTRLGVFLGKPRYDTYAFSERYKSVPKGNDKTWNKFKTNVIMKVPKDRHLPKKVTQHD
jgi:hypothetical protein